MIFDILSSINEFIWGYVAFILIFALGAYFSVRSRFFQVRHFGSIVKSFIAMFKEKAETDNPGVHPLKIFFASIGGCIGIGNVVAICSAVQIGGPGALFWTWIGGFAGMLIQYSEVFLGMRYRVKNESGSYDGGPMFFLPKAYRMKWIAPVVCTLLCFYGVEIFMFNVMAESISTNWGINHIAIVAVLLIAVVVVSLGGIKRVGEVCSGLVSFFILVYFLMAVWVLIQNSAVLPSVFSSIFHGAFTAQAATGGFAGSTIMLTLSMGLSRGAYSGDIGVGYNSVIYAESRTTQIKRQSSLTIVGIFIDTFVICTLSILVVLSTGHWNSGIDVTLMVQEALALFFPYMNVFMPIFLFLLGFTTILAYFVVGVKCAKYLSPKWGPLAYYAYACTALPLFAFVDATQAFLLMSLSGAILLVLNLFGIFLLRKEVDFGLD